MIAEYSFLPWLRRGIANQIQTPAVSTSRARLSVEVTVASDVATLQVPPKEVQLVGPGDVIGILPLPVIRTEPRDLITVTDFEPNYLAFIEFYDEDFAWRFTPAAPDTTQHRLTPWIFLLVLKGTEFDRDRRPGRPLSSVKLKAGVSIDTLFPPESQLYAWAHVHLNATLAGNETPNLEQLDVLLRNNPDKGYCRLLSPRRLEPNTDYHAFVIPTFEVGRKAGLGAAVTDNDSGLAIAWSVAKEFPVYYEWSFRTGTAGDFEELVTALQPRDIDPRVGIRDLDVQQPGFGMPTITSPPDDVVGLEGAVKAPTTVSKPLHATSNFPSEIEKQVNLAADATDTGVPGGADPVVAVPLYGRWHAMVERISIAAGDRNWVNELNADPRHRAAAGMGSLVVQKNQEEYMRLAWQQIGEVLAANRKIRDTQTAMLTSRAIYTKYLRPLPEARALPILTPVLKKVMGSPVTVHYLVRTSRLPLAALSGAMRKQLRRRGLIVKRAFAAEPPRGAGPEGAGWLGRVVEQLNAGRISAAPPRQPPTGPTLENAIDRLAPKIPEWLRALLPYNLLIAILVIVLLIIPAIVAPGVGTLLLAAAGTAATIMVYRRSQRLAAEVRAVDVASPEGMTAQAAANAPANPTFELAPAGESPPVAPGAPGPDNATARAFRQAAMEFNALLEVTAPAQPLRAALDLPAIHQTVMRAVEPERAFSERLAPQLKVGNLTATEFASKMYHDIPVGGPEAPPRQRLVPIQAYPDIKNAMYKPLNAISSDLFVPNLHLIPPNTISLMLTNQPFIEAYMVGVNYEFGRELLWREYPTDQRGSPFRQFWDPTNYVNRDNLLPKDFAEKVRDIPRIHEWRSTDMLGDHNHREAQGDRAQLILVIRGDLLKRYPNTIIYAQAAQWGTRPEDQLRLVLWDETGERIEQNPQDPHISFPIFKAEVPPDIHFIGFDLTLEQVRGHKDLAETAPAKASIPTNQLGWFFVLQEVVGEPRFGLDEEAPASPSHARRWDNLSWEHLGADVKVIDVAKPFVKPLEPVSAPTGGLTWGGNAADMASILYQKPVLVGVHGRDMLKNLRT